MTLNHFKAPAKALNPSGLKDTDKEPASADAGASPKPQIRIRTEHHPQGPYKAKPSSDLAKFEENLAQGQKPMHVNASYGSTAGQVPQTVPNSSGLSNNSHNMKHRGSNQKLPKIPSSSSQRKRQGPQQALEAGGAMQNTMPN